MPAIFCPNPINECQDPSLPTANYSAEDPDHDIFIGNNYDGTNPPPLGRNWKASSCRGICVSTISQEDADLCAARANAECPPRHPPDCDDCPATFYNVEQSCTVFCPDGSPFTYTVADGLFAGLWNQATVDAIAHSYACQKAVELRLCMGSVTRECCSGSEYNSRVNITSGGRSLNIFIIAGSLPTGLHMTPDDYGFTISGTPTEPGGYTFTVRVEDANGNFMEKTFTICVIDIAWDSQPFGTPLEDATLDSPYTLAFNAPSCATGPLSWQVSSGSLPPGMTLDEQTGVLSGSPTVLGDYSFTITVQTGAS